MQQSLILFISGILRYKGRTYAVLNTKSTDELHNSPIEDHFGIVDVHIAEMEKA
jgi:hypothetical protein